MVEWYNQRLPYAGPGFDSRPIQLLHFRSLFARPTNSGCSKHQRTINFCLFTYPLLSTTNGGKRVEPSRYRGGVSTPRSHEQKLNACLPKSVRPKAKMSIWKRWLNPATYLRQTSLPDDYLRRPPTATQVFGNIVCSTRKRSTCFELNLEDFLSNEYFQTSRPK